MRSSTNLRTIKRPFWPFSLLPIVVGGVAYALGGKHAARNAGLAVAGAALGVGLTRWQLGRLFSESPAYELELKIGDLEIRRYPKTIQAETVVELGPWEEALREGFDRLALYIFGNNDHGLPMRVTKPVLHKSSDGEKIPMTTPVLAEVTGAQEGRVFAFILPQERTIDTLPRPLDSRVLLREVPGHRVAVLAFRGRYEGDLPHQKREELLQRVRDVGLDRIGEVSFAGYDPPSTLPWVRRNEVWIEIR